MTVLLLGWVVLGSVVALGPARTVRVAGGAVRGPDKALALAPSGKDALPTDLADAWETDPAGIRGAASDNGGYRTGPAEGVPRTVDLAPADG